MSERNPAAPEATIQATPEATQLRLLAGGTPPRDWALDERTRTVGRRGVAAAREILRGARPPEPKHATPERKAS